jgi:hypothetical protein
MPGVSGVTVVTMLVCFNLTTAREAAGASSARHSLRPLFSEGERQEQNPDASRRGNAEVCSQRATYSAVMPGLDPGIHPVSQSVVSKKMDCRVKPGNDGLVWIDS